MSYRSPLLDELPVAIADDFQAMPPEANIEGRGRVPRDWSLSPCGQTPRCGPFDIPVIPRSEWAARIKEMDIREATLHHLAKASGYRIKHQASTNYCFPSGTLVRMADGTHKPIEHVKVLDEVLTAEGLCPETPSCPESRAAAQKVTDSFWQRQP